MEKQYNISLKLRKKYLAKYCKAQKGWAMRQFLYRFLKIWEFVVIIGFFLLADFAIISAQQSAQDTSVEVGKFAIIGVIVAFVFEFLSQVAKYSSQYQFGKPYSSRVNEKLALDGNTLEYSFLEAKMTDLAAYSKKQRKKIRKLTPQGSTQANVEKYTIQRKKVRKLTIDDHHICHIEGEGMLYKPAQSDAESHEEQHAEKVSSFSFLLDFEDADIQDAVSEWRKGH